MHTLNDISEIKTDIIEELKHDIRCQGLDNINVYEIGQYIDMVKDLAKAEKDCMEKCYYETVVEAMNEHNFEGEFEIEAEGRMGYDTRRYSNGRYAPKGRGHYSPVHGYTPMQAHIPMTDTRMGYPRVTNSQTGTSHSTRYGYTPMDDGYGKAYDHYQEAKRGYHETHSPEHKEMMDHHAKEHVEDSVDSIKDIWKDATPELKKDIKGNISKLLAEMQL